MPITVNITKLFRTWEPWDCSNSVANLGSRAAELTWNCAMDLAAEHAEWLLSPLENSLYVIRHNAAQMGAWSSDEINNWTPAECLAYLVQVLAYDMRLLGSDDNDFEYCLHVFNTTNWDAEPEYPDAMLYSASGEIFADWGE